MLGEEALPFRSSLRRVVLQLRVGNEELVAFSMKDMEVGRGDESV